MAKFVVSIFGRKRGKGKRKKEKKEKKEKLLRRS
jgi:hypothetical protein